MARTTRARRERGRLRHVLPCLGKNFVLIPVLVPDPPFDWKQFKRLRDALLASGAVKVVYGGVPEAILQPALTNEIRIGNLPKDVQKLASQIEDITVFFRMCAKDIRAVVERIEYGIPNCQRLQVDELFVNYKCFKKDILYLGIPDSSDLTEVVPADSSDIKVVPADSSDIEVVPESSIPIVETKGEPLVAWRSMDDKIRHYYMLDTDFTGLSETTFQELMCAVYGLFVNKDFLLRKCRKGDVKDSSPFLDLLLKLLGGLIRMVRSHFSVPEDGAETAVLQKLLSFQKQVDILFTRLTDLDQEEDASIRLFMSNIGIDWADILKVTVESSSELQNSLQSIVSALVAGERADSSIDRKLLKDSIEVLKASSLYKTIVEVPYMRSAAVHYSSLSKRLIRILDFGEYVKEVEMLMEKELNLVRQFMDPKCESEIINIILKETIADYIIRLVVSDDSHLSHLIAAGSYDDINRMFRLVLKIPDGSASLCTALTGYMRRTLAVLVADKEKGPVEYIQLILDEREKFERIIRQSLRRDMQLASKFSFTLREISSESLYLPEYLSLFMDHILVQKSSDLQAAAQALDKSVILVADLDDKSVFQIYYQRHFADRLLNGEYNEELELAVISKLKFYCCPLYLERLRTMLCDMTASKSLMKQFTKCNLSCPSICVHILTQNCWPKQPAITCNLPDEIMEMWELFRDYYLGLHDGRQLTWSPSLGNAVLTARFSGDQEYELTLPMYHLCILMLFNSEKILTFDEIKKRTNIPHAHLKKCLVALTSGGDNVLHKESIGQITKKDRFFVNDSFCSKFQKLRFSSVVSLKHTHVVLDEHALKHTHVVIDSVIVKMLKEKAVGLQFNNVVEGLASYLKNKIRITSIAVKRRLDALMMWEVVRKEQRHGKMHYVYYMY